MNKIIELENWRSENENEGVWCRAAVLHWDIRGNFPAQPSSWPMLFFRSRCSCSRRLWRPQLVQNRQDQLQLQICVSACAISGHSWISYLDIYYWKVEMLPTKTDGSSPRDEPSFLSVCYGPDRGRSGRWMSRLSAGERYREVKGKRKCRSKVSRRW